MFTRLPKWVLITFSLVAFLAIFLILNQASKISNQGKIKIGMDLELSGDLGVLGQSSKKGAELAIKQINSSGGLLVGSKKYPVDLVIEDNKSDQNLAKIKAQNLIKDNALVIIGPISSASAKSILNAREKSKLKIISPLPGNLKNFTNEKFVEDYRSFYTSTPDNTATVSYEIINLTLKAIQNAKSLTSLAILESINNMDEFSQMELKAIN